MKTNANFKYVKFCKKIQTNWNKSGNKIKKEKSKTKVKKHFNEYLFYNLRIKNSLKSEQVKTAVKHQTHESFTSCNSAIISTD